MFYVYCHLRICISLEFVCNLSFPTDLVIPGTISQGDFEHKPLYCPLWLWPIVSSHVSVQYIGKYPRNKTPSAKCHDYATFIQLSVHLAQSFDRPYKQAVDAISSQFRLDAQQIYRLEWSREHCVGLVSTGALLPPCIEFRLSWFLAEGRARVWPMLGFVTPWWVLSSCL